MNNNTDIAKTCNTQLWFQMVHVKYLSLIWDRWQCLSFGGSSRTSRKEPVLEMSPHEFRRSSICLWLPVFADVFCLCNGTSTTWGNPFWDDGRSLEFLGGSWIANSQIGFGVPVSSGPKESLRSIWDAGGQPDPLFKTRRKSFET